MPRVILAFIALAILAAMAVSTYQAGLETAGDDITVGNESFTPDASNVTTLDDSGRGGAYYSENVTVYDENGTVMEPGADYEWLVGNGTVRTLSGGGLDGDSDAKITYSYQQTTREQRRMAALLGELPRVMGLVLPVGALLVLLVFVRGG